MPEVQAPSVAVIVPSYNGAQFLRQSLPSLLTQTAAAEIVVADNASTDETAHLLAREFPTVRRVALTENLGFGAAINRAVATTRAEVIVVMGNDTICEPDLVQALCDALDVESGFVMAAGVLLIADDPARIDSAGIVFDRTLFAVDYLHGQSIEVLEAPPAPPLGPTGGAAAYARAAFDAVGGFDERFFLYLEDVDLVARLLLQGGRCRLVPGARALHLGSATFGSGSRRKNELMGWSRGYTVSKYRLHRRPSSLARVLLMESPVVLGQLVIDRTTVGLPARLAGFRAGLAVPETPIPALHGPASELSMLEALRYRLSRRKVSRRLPSWLAG